MRLGLTRSSFSAAAAFASILLALPMLWAPSGNPPLHERFTPELVELHAMFDATNQSRAHRVALVLVAALGLGGMLLADRGRMRAWSDRAPQVARGVRWLSRRGEWVAGVALAGLLAQFSERAAISLGVGVLLTELLSRAAPWLGAARTRTVLSGVTALYVALLILPGLALPLDLSGHLASVVPAIEAHYSAVMGSAGRLALGEGAASFNYGALLPTLFAIFARAGGAPEFGSEVRVVQLMQGLFALLAAAAYAIWRPRRPLAVVLPLLLIAPSLSNFNTLVWFPNQTAWRFIGFPLAALGLLAVRRRDAGWGVAIWLGGVSALLLVSNLETGIAASVGFCVYLASRAPVRLGPLVAHGIGYLVGVGLGLGVFAGFFRASLGYWPLETARSLLADMGHVASGYAGSPLPFDPLALLLFAHAAFTVIRGAIRWRAGALGPDASFRVAIATTLLIWFAYYVNRPWAMNLWTLLFLYGFLLADLLDPRVLALRGGRPARVLLPARTAILAFLVFPAAIALNWQAVDDARRAVKRLVKDPVAEPEERRVSGVWLDAEAASSLERRAAYLRAAEGDRLLSLSASVYLLPRLSGLQSPLTVRDAFNGTLTPGDFDGLVAEILALAPERILFDADPRFAGPPQQQQFVQRLQTQLGAVYRRDPDADDWQVWVRTGASPPTPPPN